jgi:hypothetical protein
MPKARTNLVLVLVLVLVLEMPRKPEDENENEDEDDPFEPMVSTEAMLNVECSRLIQSPKSAKNVYQFTYSNAQGY